MYKLNKQVIFSYLLLCLLTLVLFRITHLTPILYFPLLLGFCLIFYVSPKTGLGIVVCYLSVEGAMKLFSNYSIVFRLAIDILIAMLMLRLLYLRDDRRNKINPFKAPYYSLFFIHALWILVQFFNPYSIGLEPSLAAYKVYISSLLLYFIAYTVIDDENDVKTFVLIFCALAAIQVVFSIYQFQIGERGIAQWSSNYIAALGDKFRGEFFRPFGTSNVPGGGTTLIYLSAPVILGLIFQRITLFRTLCAIAFLTIVCYVLFISQIRSALIKTIAASAICLFFLMLKNKNIFQHLIFLIIILVMCFSYIFSLQDSKYVVALQRIEALSEAQTVWSNRSQGSYDTTITVLTERPLGLGLSRVGAASAPFKDRIQKDAQFGLIWSFADNLYKALLIEIGVPGFIFFLAFFLSILIKVIFTTFKSHKWDRFTFYSLRAGMMAAVLASILGHIASEGFLYQPESSVVWLFLGILMKVEIIGSGASQTKV